MTPAARVRGVGGRFGADPRVKKYGLPALVILLVFLFPFYATDRGAPLEFFFVDFLGMDIDTVFQMAEYVMLALGLNIVVGYAGLLDLGYVAFFALGAYTLGWFGSGLSPTETSTSWTRTRSRLGIHMSFWVVMILAGVVAGSPGSSSAGRLCACAGDYLAIVTGFGEIIPGHLPQRRSDAAARGRPGCLPFVEFGAHNLTNGVRGVTQLDRPGFGETLDNATGRKLPTATARSRPS